MDWGRLLDRQIMYSHSEEILDDLWQEWEEAHPSSQRPFIDFSFGDLISTVDKRRLLYDAALYEKEHNCGKGLSY